MADLDKDLVGSIREIYPTYLSPLIFETVAEDLANRICALNPLSVLETAAGSGLVTRALTVIFYPDRVSGGLS